MNEAPRASRWATLFVACAGLSGCATVEVSRPQTAARSALVADAVAPELAYELTVEAGEDGPRSAHVVACVGGWRPAVLVPGIVSAVPFVRTEAPTRGDGRIVLPEGDRPCVEYSVDLAGLVEANTGSMHHQRASMVRETLLITAGLFLWRPPDRPADLQATLRVRLPAGMELSAPWPSLTDGVYRLAESAFRWPSRVVLGEFDRLTVELAGLGAQRDVVVLPMARRCSLPGIERWITEAAHAVAAAYGRFPVPRMQIIVASAPGPPRTEPVMFGMALRGGGPAVVLLVNALAGDGALPGEWVAIHELFHLGAPPIEADDAWLSEGVTMYYSEVLRGRRGHLDRRGTWQALHEGFERGRASRSRRDLRSESARMRHTAEYRRVYWAGAAIALTWDVALREGSGGRVGLDDAIRHLLGCCRDVPRRWPARRVVAELDRWHGSPLFSTIADRILAGTEFPDIVPLLTRLGVSVDASGVVSLDDNAPGAAWRDAIVSGAP